MECLTGCYALVTFYYSPWDEAGAIFSALSCHLYFTGVLAEPPLGQPKAQCLFPIRPLGQKRLVLATSGPGPYRSVLIRIGAQKRLGI